VISETFIVSQVEQNANLGKPFLKKHKCHINFNKSAVIKAGRMLAFVDKFGRPLVRGVQVVHRCTIPGHSQAAVYCRVNCKKYPS